ncbi:transporter, hydrophobe/amphiphile efflux-1 (HAE1) family [Desulfovibrio sp. X2]|uniref:efflux RND transporter permease subunit n=1 Tax=Desulfovibrio sp. X2 TaxID=941449 RepID=UPI0003588B1E|nr:multidrug efflux RND transporter permease subunit [Desulfovibrio sp. X2]EPR40499.1 transporter, hydrophobe/amphiphile efflux-1 (HAE1) family [Desulfovibrio sp. X2]
MFSKFFIERPILANVLAIVIMLIGVVSLFELPVAQYPDITPPTVTVSAVYPGASASVVADTVAAPIEQQVNGVEGMLYMSSKSANDGSYTLTVTFDVGTDLDMATVLVQNRVSIAEPRLPQAVRDQGITVQKKSTAILEVVALNSPDNRFDDLYISNFATLRVKDRLARIPGVGDVSVNGAAEYSMRVWLDPNRLKSYRLTTSDVENAISEQNVQVAAGQLGQAPTPPGVDFQYALQAMGRLQDVEQFENIIIKTSYDQAGEVVRLRDVARVELGAQTYNIFAQQKGKPAALVCVYLLPGANAIQVAADVHKAMEEMTPEFPEGLTWNIPFDTTRFVQAAIDEVYMTLVEAAVLVLLVIMVFLQDWRAMLVPATTVPVTILGAFVAMVALGFSVNLITLFGIILAIGIVVDDAIIIVEGAAHHMEQGLSPHDAAVKTMSELFGPIIGITLVLTAVFVPAACMGGITGQLYRQFALVIAATAVISAINAATLKPTQCALWMKPEPKGKKKNAFYRGFNRLYADCEEGYARIVTWMTDHAKACLVVFSVLIALTVWGFTRLPTGFLPEEDQGYAIIAVQLPDAASQIRTREVVDKVNAILADTKGVADWISFGGLSILDSANISNAASVFVIYEDWAKRGKDLSQRAIVTSIQRRLAGIQEAVCAVLIPPAIQGLGQAGGFEMVLQDRGSLGPNVLEDASREMILTGRTQTGLAGVSMTYSAHVPQKYVDVDRVKVKTLGVALSDVFGTLQAYLGSAYINDFNKFGRTYQVRIQADAAYRLNVDDVKRLDVRNSAGEMVPLGSLATISDTVGPQIVTRYDLYPAVSLYGAAAPGFSSGQALNLMEQMASAKLPQGMGYQWTGMAYQEKKVGSQAYFIFALAILLVYLVLAAQYESWSAPTCVILAVPLALLGTLAALYARHMDNNVYTQIGLVLLIALASKNAILIVEFARELRAEGKSIHEAAVHASRMRFRPILMTSFAFILGVVPLLTASGAGAASRQALGTAVFGGMLASTLLAVLFVPVFYVVIQTLSERLAARKKK